ncbi:MAG: YbaK/EbsC family protein [Defluviitaleaceae bacterium]|nr:YbaK/EbsC family protein [Defluviitaleaceae bacterium]
MSIEATKRFFRQHGMEDRILEFDTSSATVELAAQAAGVIPARIAKTLSFKLKDGRGFLIVAAGDARVDNVKYKNFFGVKATMLTAEEVLELTGHAVGGVCPFGINADIPVYPDVSLQRFNTVLPACGSGNSCIELDMDELFRFSNALEWIDVCKDWQE